MRQELLDNGSFEYDKELFLEAVDEAYQSWKENRNYERKVQLWGGPEKIEAFSDLYKLPTVDMNEFREHSEDLAIDPSSIKEDLSLFSSGTTTGTQSKVPKSKEGYEIGKKIFEKAGKSILPDDVGYFGIFAPSEELLEDLLPQVGNRALFKYSQWGFGSFEPDFVLDFDQNGEIEPDFEKLVEGLKAGEDRKIVFGAPPFIAGLCDYSEKAGVDLNPDVIITAGGWKGLKGASKEEFRAKIQDLFDVEAEHHLDLYGFAESTVPAVNKYEDSDPDQKRVVSSGFLYVADPDKFLEKGEIQPVKEGEEGLAVFVDPLTVDYPGVICTDDIVKKTGKGYGEDVRMEYIRRASE